MDEIDRKIIGILKENSRLKYTEIAQRVGVPEATVRYRVKSMLSEGIIKRFTIELPSLGIPCLVFVKADPKMDLAAICRQALNLGNVEFVHEITGDFDCVAFVREKNLQELNKIIDSIRSIPGVISTTSNLVLREHR